MLKQRLKLASSIAEDNSLSRITCLASGGDELGAEHPFVAYQYEVDLVLFFSYANLFFKCGDLKSFKCLFCNLFTLRVSALLFLCFITQKSFVE